MRFPLYVILNAGFLNSAIFWAFLFGSSITAKRASFFNDVVRPIHIWIYLLLTIIGLLALIGGFFGSSVWKGRFIKKVLWISIFSPLLLSSYYIFLKTLTGQKLPIAIFTGIFISTINYLVARPLLQK